MAHFLKGPVALYKTEFTIIYNSFIPNLETARKTENDDFSDYNFESILEAGVPRGTPRSIPEIKKDSSWTLHGLYRVIRRQGRASLKFYEH